MPDKTDPDYQEWKQKYDAGVARKRKEIAEWKRREEKPGFKLITRGPRKGQLVPKNYHELKAERRAIQSEQNAARIKASKEAYAQRMIENDARRAQIPTPIQSDNVEKKAGNFSPEIIYAFLFVSALSIGSLLLAKAFAAFGILGIVLLVDAIAHSIYGRKTRHSKYLPLLWWLF